MTSQFHDKIYAGVKKSSAVTGAILQWVGHLPWTRLIHIQSLTSHGPPKAETALLDKV